MQTTPEIDAAVTEWKRILAELQAVKAPNEAIPTFERYVQSDGSIGWLLQVMYVDQAKGETNALVEDAGPGKHSQTWRPI